MKSPPMTSQLILQMIEDVVIEMANEATSTAITAALERKAKAAELIDKRRSGRSR